MNKSIYFSKLLIINNNIYIRITCFFKYIFIKSKKEAAMSIWHRELPTIQFITLFFLLVLASIGLYVGWSLFWFLTDDAFIAFRYISNSMMGFGYTWNAPPFRPVEGYTSFLWVVLLDVVWRVTSVEPPESANVISLLFAYGTTFLGVVMLLKMELSSQLERIRLPLLALVLLGVLTNRTYLTWASSGLETGMFNFLITAWLFCALFIEANTARWLGLLMLTAVLTGLTRPDGLLLIAATLFLSGLTLLGQLKKGRLSFRYFMALTPVLITITHFLWRKQKYGDWLPNTYAAKYVTPWPESGWRYLLSFIIEYGLLFWVALVLFFFLIKSRDYLTNWTYSDPTLCPLYILTVIGTLLAHFAYYTFMIGGDSFEYRVYSHLVLLIWLSSVWLLNALSTSASRALLFLSLFVLCALPIQWTHWAFTHQLNTREATKNLQVAIAPHFPTLIRPYVELFDDLQFWLDEHRVGRRSQAHKVFYERQVERFPPRSIGMLLSPNTYPVMSYAAVGVASWALPTTNIIDTLGLNDYVIARNPIDPNNLRKMAHERFPPPGYVECFEPNVALLVKDKLLVIQHKLTAERILECESRPWAAGMADDQEEKLADIVKRPPTENYVLNRSWSPEHLMLNFVPPQQDRVELSANLLKNFPHYTGLGCVVIPPKKELVSRSHYLLALLPSTNRPPQSELAELFPWTQFLTEAKEKEVPPYHLGLAVRAGLEALPEPKQLREATWADKLSLLGYDLLRTSYHPGDTIHLTLYYRSESPTGPGVNVFTHLLGTTYNPQTAGPVWGQDDADPCRDLYPLLRWLPGYLVASKMAIPIPPDAPPGDYQLSVGLYNWQIGERVLLSGEMAGQDSVNLTSVQIENP